MKSSPGIFFGLLASASYAVMSFLVHLNPSQYPVGQMIFFRGVLSFFILLPFCYRDLSQYVSRDGHSLWIRSLAGAGGVICYFTSLQGTSSANANVLFSSSPIFVAFFGWILFREKLGRLEIAGIVAILFGNFFLYLPNRSEMPLWVWASAVGGAVFASMAFLSLGKATKKYSIALIIIGFSVASSLAAFLLPGAPWKAILWNDLPFLFAVGLLGLFSQWSVTISFRYLNSSVATALGRTSILFNGVLDIVIAHYTPSPLEWLAYFLVLSGIYLSHPRQKAAAPSFFK